MKITHNKVGQNLNLRDTGKTEQSGKTDKTSAASVNVKDTKANAVADLGAGAQATKVNLSNRAQDIKRAKEIAMATPDVNEEKVARLQKLIDAGEYKVDSEAIAGKMLDEQMNWE